VTLLSLALAVLCLVILPELLHGFRGLDRAPRAGIALWTSWYVVGWFAALNLFLRVAINAGSTPSFDALLRFASRLSDGHPLRGLGMGEVVGLSLATDVVVLWLATLFMTARATYRVRREHRSILGLVADPCSLNFPVHVLDHDQPLAYYLPGEGGRIVISSATLSLLEEDQTEAIVAHEEGHRRGRHEHLLVPLQTAGSFVRFLPLSIHAPLVIRGYLEMLADDFASRATSRRALAGALGRAALFARAPRGAFSATELLVERRVERLRREPVPEVDVGLAALLGAISLSLAATLLLVS